MARPHFQIDFYTHSNEPVTYRKESPIASYFLQILQFLPKPSRPHVSIFLHPSFLSSLRIQTHVCCVQPEAK
ncbi:hypothetical protein BDR06DRAFT_954536 [Suillus hirtellus]|nr:hypothetical protein BDR06DRAFT_954536 [Suillus hirtellus]